MKKQISVTIYDYKDHPNKQLLLEKHSDINTRFDWWDFEYDNFKEQHSEWGITKIYFSGFSSQGDGAMFEYQAGEEVFNQIIDKLDLPNWKKKVLKHAEFCGSGTHIGRYYHAGCCDHRINAEQLGYDKDNIDYFLDEQSIVLKKELKHLYSNLCNKLYRQLEEQYDYLTSKEAIIETLEENEYFFTKDGEIYNS